MESYVENGEIKEVRDGMLPNFALISISPDREQKHVSLTIGASENDSCASLFTKKSLRELISVLLNIHEAMND